MKFQKIGNSDPIPFVYASKVEISKYVQYDVSMTICRGRMTNQRKTPKWQPFKTKS